MTVAFRCSRGLASALESRILGTYDGSGAWQVFVPEMAHGQEQLFVEIHEGMHHELQASTGWGLVSAMSAELAIRGYRTASLRDLFTQMIEPSRSVHEMFATAISSFVLGTDRARELLLGNVLYSDYLRQAERLVPRSQAPTTHWHEAAITAVLRAAMSPTSAMDLLDIGFARLEAADLDEVRNTPQARIDAYRRSSASSNWQGLLDRIAADHPEHLADIFEAAQGQLLSQEDPAFQSRRAFDEEVLLPACFAHVEQALNQAGYPTIPFGAQADLARRVKTEVAAVDSELAERLNVVTERRPVADDGLEYDRQQLVLRERLPAVVRPYTGHPADRDFLMWEGQAGPSMVGVWVSVAAARKQWAFTQEDADDLTGTLRALVQVGLDRETSAPLAVIAPLTPTDPREVQSEIGDDVPLLVLTTLSSLVDPDLVRELDAVEPVFVLMDLPVAHHVASWTSQGLEVRMAAAPLTGTTADLSVLAFTIAEAPAFVFLSLGGSVAISLLIERLRRTHGNELRIDADVLLRHQSGLNLAVAKVLAAWHVLDQDGVEDRGLDVVT